MKSNSSIYMVVYVSIMGAAVALLLTGVGRFTAPLKQANERTEKIRNVLQVFGIPVAPESTVRELTAAYERAVKVEQSGSRSLYLQMAEGSAQPRAVAIDFEGPGLWGPIKGLLALEPDMTTIRGITFYQQEETPGLGGEIATALFLDRFPGKKISAPGGAPGIRIRSPGTASAANEVDAITGATMTCRKVETILNGAIASFKKEGNTP